MKCLQIANARIGELIEENYYLKEKQSEQKSSEWSEEDENILNGIIDDLNSLKQSNPSDISKEVYQEEIDWLKSLKDRYTWKPSA